MRQIGLWTEVLFKILFITVLTMSLFGVIAFKLTDRYAVRGKIEVAEVPVRYNGTGTPELIRDEIINPLLKNKEPTHMTGPDQSVSAGIIEALDGKISVTGQEVRGSLFEITSPAARD